MNGDFRKFESLKNLDRILHNAFFLGIYPGLGNQEIDYIAQNVDDFLRLHG